MEKCARHFRRFLPVEGRLSPAGLIKISQLLQSFVNMADNKQSSSDSWTSTLFKFVTGSRKRTVHEEIQDEAVPSSVAKKPRFDSNEMIVNATASSTFSLNNRSTHVFKDASFSSDIYPNNKAVLDIRSKIKAPSRTKTILNELCKLNGRSTTSNRPLYLLENSRWISTSREASVLPPRRSVFTPSRVQQISANINRSVRAERSLWQNEGSRINETVSSISSDEPRHVTTSENKKEQPAQVQKVADKTELALSPVGNRFGVTELDDDDEDVVFSFDPPEVRGPRRNSVSPSPTESSSKSDPKKNSFDSESSTSTESDAEPEKVVETKNDSVNFSSGLNKNVPADKLKTPHSFADSTRPKRWSCPTCLVQNDESKETCPCCETRNPNMKKVDVPGEAKRSKWSCPTCLVQNEADKDACPCCETRNPQLATQSDKDTGSTTNGTAQPARPFKPTTFNVDSSALSLLFGGTAQKTEVSLGKTASSSESSAPVTSTVTTVTSTLGLTTSTASPAPVNASVPVFGAAEKSLTLASSSSLALPSGNLFSAANTAPAPLFGNAPTAVSKSDPLAPTSTPSLNFPLNNSAVAPETKAPESNLSSTGFNFGQPTLSSSAFNFTGSGTQSSFALAAGTTPLFSSTPAQPNGSSPFEFGTPNGQPAVPPSSNMFSAGSIPPSNMFAPAPASSVGRKILSAKRRGR